MTTVSFACLQPGYCYPEHMYKGYRVPCWRNSLYRFTWKHVKLWGAQVCTLKLVAKVLRPLLEFRGVASDLKCCRYKSYITNLIVRMIQLWNYSAQTDFIMVDFKKKCQTLARSNATREAHHIIVVSCFLNGYVDSTIWGLMMSFRGRSSRKDIINPRMVQHHTIPLRSHGYSWFVS